MVKAYLRYQFNNTLGAFTSHTSNIITDNSLNAIFTNSNQYTLIINWKTGEIKNKLYDLEKNVEATQLCLNNNKNNFNMRFLATGYADGDIIIWNLNDNTKKCNLNGHKSQVTCLQYSEDDQFLYSGGMDTVVIVWDVLEEVALYQLNGHKNAITQLQNIIIKDYQRNIDLNLITSSSKDGLFKIWDQKIATNIETIQSNNNEIVSFAYSDINNLILLGTNSDELVCIKINQLIDADQKLFENIGVFKRNSYSRPIEMKFNSQQSLLFILTTEKTIEVYKVLSEQEFQKKQKRKIKRQQEKSKKNENEQTMEEENNQNQKNQKITENNKNQFIEHINYHTTFHFPKKLSSFSWMPTSKLFKNSIAVNYANNNIEIYDIAENPETSYLQHQIRTALENSCHHSAIRVTSISDDGNLILSGSGESIKIWDSESLQSIRSFPSRYCTCGLFLPKSRFFIIGDKDGYISLFDLQKSELIQELQAHESSIWTLNFHEKPVNCEGIVILSGGADKKLKFWELAMNKTDNQLKLIEGKSLWMPEDIHCAKYTPDGQYYAVSLLDNQVYIYFADSDKVFLSLYGHSLPVLSFDISSDNALLVSGSADKTIKLWGLDFGNCHKSLLAHQNSIMQVVFVNNTHYFFSSSKDKTIKYWDGDNYQLILQFDECLSEVWSLSVSSFGDYFVAGSNDKIMRIWKQSQEQVFIQEEQEKRVEKMLIEDYEKEKLQQEADEEDKQNIDKEGQAVAVSKKKLENLKYGEEIMAAIDLAEQLRNDQIAYENDLMEYQKFQKNSNNSQDIPKKPNLEKINNMSIPEYVLNEIGKIRTTELENSLKFVHQSYIEKILYYINFFTENNINIELASRILYFILQCHEPLISNSKKLFQLLVNIQKNLRNRLQKQKDVIGFNLQGMKMIKQDLELRNNNELLSKTDSIFTKRQNIF